MNDVIKGKLVNMLGAEKAALFMEETLKVLNLKEVKTKDEMLIFGNEMVRQGGVMAIVGRSINISARLNGARDQLARLG